MSKSKLFVTVALGLSGALGVGVAQARGPDVQWSVTIGAPVYTQSVPVYVRLMPVYTQPVPVYVRPMPVYTQPVPVYVRPLPVYTRPAPVWGQPALVYHRTAYVQPTRWDRDGDGIPNRRDRLYNPQWDRDGDGIPNRYDQQAARGWQGR